MCLSNAVVKTQCAVSFTGGYGGGGRGGSGGGDRYNGFGGNYIIILHEH